MIIIPGPASRELGEKIAVELGVEAHPVEHRIFPDGESYIRFTTPVEGKTVVIVQTTTPKQDVKLIQLYLMVGTAKDLGAEKVICVVPYLAYSRQDTRFLDGEAISLNLVIKLLEKAGADELVVIDVHNRESLDKIQKLVNIRMVNLSAIPLLAEYLIEYGYDGAYSLSPDKGAIHLAEAAASVLGGGFGFFEKKRNRRTGEIEMTVKDMDIKGKNAVVFDDIISSGGTMAKAIEGLKEQGAVKVAAACTHGLFTKGANRRIQEADVDLIIATDTVETSFSCVSVAPLIAGYLKKT